MKTKKNRVTARRMPGRDLTLCASLTAFVLLAAFLLLLSGCGKDGKDSEKKVITVPASDVVSAIMENAEVSDIDSVLSFGQEDFDRNFQKLYGIDIKLVDDGAFAFNSAGSSANEITVLRAKNADDIDTITSALQQRLTRRAQDFGGYRPEEAAKAQEGKVFACSNYVMLAICEDSSAARSAFMKFMQNA
ncbi:MAG: DUF4358 domain-containing protein [Anaerovoracaceae bacterium]